MARPRKCRRVCGMPRTNSFAPMGSQLCEERIIMAVDEYETIRLIDLAGYTQEECAAQMGIASVCILELSFLHKDPLCFFGLP